jgi:hypothetical protein
MATNGSTDTQIISGVNGSGTYLPMSFYTNNALAGQFGTDGVFTASKGIISNGGGAIASNTAVGYQAGYSNTTGNQNIFFGYTAGYTATTSTNLIAIGFEAAKEATGSGITAVGTSAAFSSTGNDNSAFGSAALLSTTSGANNTALGRSALRFNTTGSYNTAVGYQAGYNITTGIHNVNIGSLDTVLTTGSYNTQIGRYANASSSSVSYALLINTDNTARTDKGSSTGFIFTGGAMYQGNNSASWTTTSDAKLKKNIVDNNVGLDVIKQIKVRNFEYRTKDEITELEPQNAVDIQGVQLGVIAQELQQVLPECVNTESTGVMSVDTTNLTWYLVNAVKELKTRIEALENK